MSDPAGDPDPPLDYRNPDEDRDPNRAGKLVGGVVVGAVLTTAVGAVLFCGTVGEASGGAQHHLPQAIGFGLAAVAAGFGVALLPDRSRRTYLVGCLIGLLVMCLVEGTCFFNP